MQKKIFSMILFLWLFHGLAIYIYSFPNTNRSIHNYPDKTGIFNNISCLMTADPEELWIEFKYKNYGSAFFTVFSIDSVLYLPVCKILNYLHIKCTQSAAGKGVEGFLGSENNIYKIDYSSMEIICGNRSIKINESDIFQKEEYYVNSVLFEKVFDLKLVFDKREQSLSLFTEMKLPIDIQNERSLERARHLKKSEIKSPELLYKRKRNLFNAGLIDWALGYNYMELNNNLLFYSLGLGAELMGGDIQSFISSSNKTNINWNNVPWRWRYVANETPYFRQISLGEVNINSHPFYTLKGIQISGAPIEPRSKFTNDSISGITNPHWETDLYSHENLLAYSITDSGGKYGFGFPLEYGLTKFKQKISGLYGEEKNIERVYYIPNNFLPPGEFDYTLSFGKLKYRGNLNTFHADFRYGVSKYLTLNSGIIQIDKMKMSPFVNLNYRLLDNLFINGEYYSNEMIRLHSGYYSFSNIQTSLDIRQYFKNSFFNPQKSRYFTMFSMFIPVTGLLQSSSFNLFFNNHIFEDYDFLYGSLAYHLNMKNFSPGIEYQYSKLKSGNNFMNENSSVNLSFYKTLWWNIYFNSGVNIDIKAGNISQLKLSLNKNIADIGFVNLSYIESRYSTDIYFGIRISLPFMESNSTIMNSSKNISFIQNFNGTIAFDKSNRDIILFKDNWIGKSSLTVLPFIDENNNDVFDENEKVIQSDLDLKPVDNIIGTRKYPYQAGLSRYIDLLPYSSYRFEVDPVSLEDPFWKPKYRNILVETDPNNFKPVYLPVCYTGTVSGKITDETGNLPASENLKIRIRNDSDKTEFASFVFSDGSIYQEGIFPGTYSAFIDPEYLNKYLYSSFPESLKFVIKSLPMSDNKNDLNFILKADKKRRVLADLSGKIIPVEYSDFKDTSKIILSGKSVFPKCAVEIRNNDMNKICITDSAGNFSYPNIRPGKWTIRILNIFLPKNFIPVEDSIVYNLLAGDNISVKINIRPEIKPIDKDIKEIKKPSIRLNRLKILSFEGNKPEKGTEEYLDAVADLVINNRNRIIRIDGHTDNTGSLSEKQIKSEMRAIFIKKYLIKKGVKPGHIYTRGWGDRKPLIPNAATKEKARNNRVEIRIERK
jgi:outer membrane protein OmpA-like peptidoglycan-associated protein